MPWQFYAVHLLLGTVFVGFGGYRLWRERELRVGGVSTYAVIVAHDVHYGAGDPGGIHVENRSADPGRPTRFPWSVGTGDRSLTQAPIVEFTTAEGRTVRARSRVSTTATSFTPGRVVTVHYDLASPQEVAIDGHGRGLLRLFVAIGVLLFVIATVFAVVPDDELGPWIAAGVPLILGSAFLGIGGHGVARVVNTRRRGTAATGTIVGESTSSTREGITLYHPVVRFQLPTGHTVDVPSERGRVLGRPQRGENVTVRYLPEDPYRMALAGDRPRPLFVLFSFVGALILAGGLIVTAIVVL
ncbi:DUF3592 domain-containing protein [Spiractinospora alimapuensis]|uniref:DUF3592 domain-containing protein n=1 Tax=Spiractinospora alimapuensis TaxID=2820884 RepID=UPI001F2FB55F|nr:DUF3592 domain-containing protein [Spiractinospora alimapuensis]QVQ50649.1 DUF3592 domain-containing protein [Spiractinospora alimapuensis]